MNRASLRRTMTRASIAFLVATFALQSPITAQQSAAPDQWDAVLPEYQSFLEGQIEGDLSTYTVEAAFLPATAPEFAQIEGTLTLDWVNPSDEAVSEIPIRLYANDPRYRDGSIAISDVEIEGEEVEPVYADTDEIDVSIPLTEDLDPEDHIELTLSFVSTIPNDILSGYGMFSHDSPTDTYTLDHWLPLVAGYDPENGFELEPVSQNGDPVFSTISYFDVTFTAPSEMVVASTGTESDTSADDGLTTSRYVSGPVRDFTLAISPNFEVATGEADGVEIRSYYLPGHEERGEAVRDWTVTAVQLFNDLIGPYPYEQLSVIDAPIGGGAAGIEFPQIIFIGSWYYDESLANEGVPHGQEFTVVHEVLHQWWYGLVGNNQYQHAFLDESLTNYLTTVYFERVYSEEVAQQQMLLNILAPYLIYLYGVGGAEHDDEVIDTPTDAFSTGLAYGVIIYNKGPLAFQAIREAMGDDSFFTAISSYFDANALHIARPDDLLSAFEAEAAPGLDIDEVWEHWINEANGKTDIPLEDALEILRSLGI
ncbi:M1 family metallopeptidase [soil metagenome]